MSWQEGGSVQVGRGLAGALEGLSVGSSVGELLGAVVGGGEGKHPRQLWQHSLDVLSLQASCPHKSSNSEQKLWSTHSGSGVLY